MGKTFRRGGSEQGYYSPGKSLRDKRQKGSTSHSTWANGNIQPKTKMHQKRKSDQFIDNNEW